MLSAPMRLKSVFASLLVIANLHHSGAAYAGRDYVTVNIQNNSGFKLETVPAKPDSDECRLDPTVYGCAGSIITPKPDGAGFVLQRGFWDLTKNVKGSLVYDIENDKGHLVANCTLFAEGAGLSDGSESGAFKFCQSNGFVLDNSDAVYLTFPEIVKGSQTQLYGDINTLLFEALLGTFGANLLLSGVITATANQFYKGIRVFGSQWSQPTAAANFQKNLAKYEILKAELMSFQKNFDELKAKEKKWADGGGEKLNESEEKELDRLHNIQYDLNKAKNDVEKSQTAFVRYAANYQMAMRAVIGRSYESSDVQKFINDKIGPTANEVMQLALGITMKASVSQDAFATAMNIDHITLRADKMKRAIEYMGIPSDDPEFAVKSPLAKMQYYARTFSETNRLFKFLGRDIPSRLLDSINRQLEYYDSVISELNKNQKGMNKLYIPALANLQSARANIIKAQGMPYGTVEQRDTYRQAFDAADKAAKILKDSHAVGDAADPQLVKNGANTVRENLNLSNTHALVREEIKRRNWRTGTAGAGYRVLDAMRAVPFLEFASFGLMLGIPLGFYLAEKVDNEMNPIFSTSVSRLSFPELVKEGNFCNPTTGKCEEIEHAISKYIDMGTSGLFVATYDGGVFLRVGTNTGAVWKQFGDATVAKGANDHQVLPTNVISEFAACSSDIKQKTLFAVGMAVLDGKRGGLTFLEIDNQGALTGQSKGYLGTRAGPGGTVVPVLSLFERSNIHSVSFLKDPKTKDCYATVIHEDSKTGQSFVSVSKKPVTYMTNENDFQTISIAGADLYGNGFYVDGDAIRFVNAKGEMGVLSLVGRDGGAVKGGDVFGFDFLMNGLVMIRTKQGIFLADAKGQTKFPENSLLHSAFSDSQTVLQDKPKVTVFDDFLTYLVPEDENAKGLVALRLGLDQEKAETKFVAAQTLFADEHVESIVNMKEETLPTETEQNRPNVYQVETKTADGKRKSYHVSYDFAQSEFTISEMGAMVYHAPSDSLNITFHSLPDSDVVRFDAVTGQKQKIGIPEKVEDMIEIRGTSRLAYHSEKKVYVSDLDGKNVKVLPGLENITGRVDKILSMVNRHGQEQLLVSVAEGQGDLVGDPVHGVFLFSQNEAGDFVAVLPEGEAIFSEPGFYVTDIFFSEDDRLNIALHDFGVLRANQDIADFLRIYNEEGSVDGIFEPYEETYVPPKTLEELQAEIKTSLAEIEAVKNDPDSFYGKGGLLVE